MKLKTIFPLFLIFILFLLFSCNKTTEPDSNNPTSQITTSISINYHNGYGKTCFVNQPINFGSNIYINGSGSVTSEDSVSYLWNFGDGTSSNESPFIHAYENTGIYSISLTSIVNGEEAFLEKELKIVIHPKYIENTSAKEKGKHIYETSPGLYSILYTYNTGTSVDEWYIMNYQDSTITLKSEIDWIIGEDLKMNPILESNNLTLITDRKIRKYSGEGTLISSSSTFFNSYRDAEVFNNGYLALENNPEVLKLEEINSAGEILLSKEFALQIDGFHRYNASQNIENEIFLNYIDDNFTAFEGRKSLIRRIDLDSTTIWEKEYESLTLDRIIKLSDGYLITGIRDEMNTGKYFMEFAKIDNEGNLIWQSSREFYSNNFTDKVVVFENGNDIFVFFDNMRGVLLSETGEILFDKFYGENNDYFNAAIRNSEGEYVLLGTSDNPMDLGFYHRDLVIIKVDENGERIE